MKADVIARLQNHAPCVLRVGVQLAPYTTFQIGGPAALLAEPKSSHELLALLKLIRDENLPHFYLGLGSNILVSDQGIDAVVIRSSGAMESIYRSNGTIHAGPSGKLLHLTTYVAVRNLTGMEPLSGIPGSVGGGLYMNAGAYGGEISDTFVSADVITSDLRIVTLTKDEIGFGYRMAPAFRNTIILESRYTLREGDRASIFAEMRKVWKLRRDKQPLEFPSAGSIFKRPPGDYAGRLIEAVDGKGLRVGGAMVSEKHAGIFVNAGKATAADVTALVREVRGRVYAKFGIMLETEVMPIGFNEDPFAITH